MSLQRSGSQGSIGSDASGASGFSDSSRQSGASSKGVGGGGGENKGHDELLDENQSMLKGVFGVLFTISKEKVDTSKRFVVAKLVLEWVQFLFLVLNPSFGWHIDPNFWVWRMIDMVNFKNPIVSQGYAFYIGILYTVSMLLVLSAVLCVWVGYCFQLQRFPFVWPIQVLRLFVSVFFMVFYIASLGVFLVAINCHWLGDTPYTVAAFPEVQCLSMPHMIHMAVAIVLMLLFIVITVAATAADFELDPISKRWLACALSDVEVRIVMIRTVTTVAFSLLSDLRKPQTLLIACSIFYGTWSFIRWQPHMFQWVNHVRAAYFGSLAWAAFLLLVLTFSGQVNDEAFCTSITTAMLAGLFPFGLFCCGVSFLRYRWTYNRALAAFRAAPLDTNLREIWRWGDIEEVEMVSRICRTPDAEDDEKQDEASVKLAERVFKGGMSFFSGKAEMVILYANFMIEVSHQAAAGHSQLVAAKNLKPGIVQQFAIFVREQVHMQAAQTQASGEGSTDLVSYVEFQKHQRLLARSHRQALLSTRSFWRLLMDKEVSFTALSQAFNMIEESHARADKTYKTVLERYSSSAKVLRMYAHFLEEVKNDPWGAARFLAESEKLEEQQAAAENSALLGGDGDQGAVDARNSPVCVINAQGIIQMANKLLLNLYGYKRGELDGKNVSCLMPQPFSGRHNTYLRNHLTTGKAKILDSVRDVLGLHRERHVFPARILVSKVSGDGMDSVFMAVFKTVAEDKSLVQAYVAPGGSVLCCDMRFMDWFGRNPADLQGRPFHTLGVEQGQLEQLISLAAETSEADLNNGKVAARGVHLIHRYSTPVEVDIVLQLGGTETNRILIYNIRRKAAADLMMAADARGKVVYCTTNMAEMLHYEPRDMHGLHIKDLIAQPYAQLHTKWMKTNNARIPPGSCRGNATVVMTDALGTGVPVRCEISEREIDEKTYHVVSFHRSTFDAGVAQQRLRLKLDPTRPGIVLEYHKANTAADDAAAAATAADAAAANGSGEPQEAQATSTTGAFGQKTSMYAHRHISSFVDVFRAAREKEGGTIASCTELLESMISIAREKPGMSFRVGVHPPVDEAKLADPPSARKKPASATVAADVAAAAMAAVAEAAGAAPAAGVAAPGGARAIDVHAMERQMLQRETKPAVMRIEIVKIGEGEDALEEMYLDLYNANAITGVIEINRSGVIVKPSCCSMHLPGPMFGVVSRAMNTKSIRKYLQLPSGAKVIKALMTADGNKKTRGALKNSHDSKQIGPLKVLEATHADGRPLKVECECITKESNLGQHRYLLRIKMHKPGFGYKDFPQMIQEMRERFVNKANAGVAVATLAEDDDEEDSDGDDDNAAEAAGAAKTARALPHNEPPPPPPPALANGADSPTNVAMLPRSPRPDSFTAGDGEGDNGGGLRDEPTLESDGHNAIMPPRLTGPSDLARPSEDRRRGPPAPGANGTARPQASGPSQTRGRRASFQLGDEVQPGEGMLAAAAGADASRAAAQGGGGGTQWRDSGGGNGQQIQLRGRVAPKMGGGDDAGSEGGSEGGSEALSGSEFSGAASQSAKDAVASDPTNDYRRGKRNKRLQALLSSRKAQAILVRFQNHSIIATLLLLTVHICCFVALVITITTQTQYLNELAQAGDGVVHLHSVCTWTRVMDALYRNQTAGSMSPPLYAPGDESKYVALLAQDVDNFETIHHGVYLGFTKLRRLNDGSTYSLRSVWEDPIQVVHTWVDTYQSHEENVNMTLWQLGNDFILAAREVMANAQLMNASGTPLYMNREFYFVIQNGPQALYYAYKSMLDQLLNRCLSEVKLVKTTLMILLVVEACILVVAANLYLIHLLSRVGTYRFHVYSIFLVIPTMLLRALASKKVMIDGEEDQEEEEEQEAAAQKSTTGAGAAALAGAVQKSSVSTAALVPAGGSGWGAKGQDRKVPDTAIAAGSSGLVPVKTSLWDKVKALFGFGTKSALQPIGANKKRLIKSPFDSFLLLVPFLLWAVLIIVIYPLSYITLSDLDTPVAMVNVVNFLSFRVRREIFFVHEVCSAIDATDRNASLVDLQGRTADFTSEWEAAMFGPTAAEQATQAHFAAAASITFQSAQDQALFYRNHACLRSGADLYEQACFTLTDRYYQISQQGVAAMLDRALEEATAVLNDAPADLNFTSPRLDYMWRVGLYDLGDGLLTARDYAITLANSKLQTVMTFNIILLVLSILLAGFFILFMVQPFLDRARKESRRVAELLSQLPHELNVEKLVIAALAGGGLGTEADFTDSRGGSGGSSGKGAAKAAEFKGAQDSGSLAEGDDDDDDKQSVASSL